MGKRMTAFDLYRFNGRLGRFAFALTQIGVFTASYVAIFLMIILSGAGDESAAKVTWLTQGSVSGLTMVLFLNAAWISLAAAVKRCHDRDLSGWMLLFVMPPILGQLWLVLCLVSGPGTAGPHRHGTRGAAGEPTNPWSADLSQLDAL